MANLEQAEIEAPEETEQTDEQKVSAKREALVEELTEWVRAERDFWNPVYEQMRDDIKFAAGKQWPDEPDDHSYKVNFIPRQLNQEQASVYAQNPTLKCTRSQRMEYTVWDGTREALDRAKLEIETAMQQTLQTTAQGAAVQEPPPEASAIVQDYAAGLARKKVLDKIAETLELLFKKQWDAQTPDFETQMKQAVIREKTTGVCFVGVKFERQNESVPTVTASNSSVIDQLNAIQAKASEIANGEAYNPDSACHEELSLMLQSLAQATQAGAVRPKYERLVFDFKPSTSIIVDRKCRCLTEFQGAERIAEQFFLTPDQIEGRWNKNVREDAVRYGSEGAELKVRKGKKGKATTAAAGPSEWPAEARACVWILYDKLAQMRYVICDGFKDFLEEPEAPWPVVTGFWTIATLKYRSIEVEENLPGEGITIYGQSDVALLRPMQQEMNRSQEAKRGHRKANRPGHICAAEAFESTDLTNIQNRADNAVIPIKAVSPGQDLRGLLMPIPTVELDPALYEDSTPMRHVALVSGSQSANVGEQAPDEKATGQAIAEQSRISGVSSAVDSQDKFLNTLSRIGSEMMLREMSEGTVRALVGPGAVWPRQSRAQAGDQAGVVTRDDCIEQLLLKVEAASAGRPNRSAEIQNFERMMPLFLQMAQTLGLPLDPLLRHAAKIMDFRFDLDEWLASRGQGMLPMMAPGAAGQTAPMTNQAPQGTPASLPVTAQRMAPAPVRVG